MTLFDVLSRQRRLVYLLVTLLSVAGLWAASILPSAIYPELNFSRVTIVATGTPLGARQELFGVTRPIEEAASIVPGGCCGSVSRCWRESSRPSRLAPSRSPSPRSFPCPTGRAFRCSSSIRDPSPTPGP